MTLFGTQRCETEKRAAFCLLPIGVLTPLHAVRNRIKSLKDTIPTLTGKSPLVDGSHRGKNTVD
eukprot:1156236-Pelagomonas_calceolata.AAC.2